MCNWTGSEGREWSLITERDEKINSLSSTSEKKTNQSQMKTSKRLSDLMSFNQKVEMT